MHPWRRWGPRYLDYLIVTVILGVGLSFAAPESGLLGHDYLLGALAALIWIPIEGLLVATIATTPGKALVGLSVQTTEGTVLSSPQALGRAMRAWLTGCAMLLPLVSLVTMNTQYNRLRSGHQATWDDTGGFRVHHEPLSLGRKILLVGVVSLFVILMVLGSAASPTKQ